MEGVAWGTGRVGRDHLQPVAVTHLIESVEQLAAVVVAQVAEAEGVAVGAVAAADVVGPARLERADRRARRVAGVYSEITIEPRSRNNSR